VPGGQVAVEKDCSGFFIPFGLGNYAGSLVLYLSLLPPSPASAPVRGEEERGRWKELWSPDV